MATNQGIKFKDPEDIIVLLEAALESEQEKYQQCPVAQDAAPGYQKARAWGYVVAGYFLLEESFKALLYLRGTKVERKHSLTMLFDLFPADDKEIVREYYSDYRATIGGYRSNLPFETLDEFLENLDGGTKGEAIGSFDWRYFLIEEAKSKKGPFISIHYLHEVVYGCNSIIKYIHRGNNAVKPRLDTHSWRLHLSRGQKYDGWLNARAKTEDWSELPDRLEILWGPDYRGRYDILVFRGETLTPAFSELPESPTVQILDKRQELGDYEVEE